MAQPLENDRKASKPTRQLRPGIVGVEVNFPPPETRERLQTLFATDTSATDLLYKPDPANPSNRIVLNSEEITTRAFDFFKKNGRNLRINMTKAGKGERDLVTEANAIIDESQAQNGIIEEDRKKIELISESEEEQREQDLILQGLTTQTIENPILRSAFGKFVHTIISKPNIELARAEWSTYLAQHDISKNVTNPSQTHHWNNIGLPQSSENEELRAKVAELVTGIVEEHKKGIEKVFKVGTVPHKNPEMNIPENRAFALVLAELSNWIRAAFLEAKSGSLEACKYLPREIALKIRDIELDRHNLAIQKRRSRPE